MDVNALPWRDVKRLLLGNDHSSTPFRAFSITAHLHSLDGYTQAHRTIASTALAQICLAAAAATGLEAAAHPTAAAGADKEMRIERY